MPVLNRIAGFADEMKEWRHWLHRNPELGFDLPKTAAFVAGKLSEIGVDEIHEGIAETGIVAIINGQGPGPTIGLRADMDALPITETTGAPHASETPGVMHACGHDGHTTMLLGAAKYLTETRRFKGRVALIFQPAEEGGGGGGVMVREGIMDRFDIAQVYGIHNAPTNDFGVTDVAKGPIMASADEFFITFKGTGGHAARPEVATDPLMCAVSTVQALQSIVSRNRPGFEPMILSVTQIHAGGPATNIIWPEARIGGTVRAFSEEIRNLAEHRITEIVMGQASAFGVTADVNYERSYPPTINDAEKAAFAADVAREIVGPENVNENPTPKMGSEDFSYMLNERPGAYVRIGQGKGVLLHQPNYDFNDDIAPVGASFFARLVETAQPL
ncbi:MAG: M20 aminoacylase family protein [Paracoccaceae bacterium]|nr:M20 aminoacylase family protein [Paracoccaceae bacterium]